MYLILEIEKEPAGWIHTGISRMVFPGSLITAQVHLHFKPDLARFSNRSLRFIH